MIVHSAHPHKSFLSTLSLRRATDTRPPNLSSMSDFYPRSPCGERPPNRNPCPRNRRFLSTLSLRRATFPVVPVELTTLVFLSTLSLRRATRRHRGNDRSPIYFYPRSPCGERLDGSKSSIEEISISIHALLAESDETSSQ